MENLGLAKSNPEIKSIKNFRDNLSFYLRKRRVGIIRLCHKIS